MTGRPCRTPAEPNLPGQSPRGWRKPASWAPLEKPPARSPLRSSSCTATSWTPATGSSQTCRPRRQGMPKRQSQGHLRVRSAQDRWCSCSRDGPRVVGGLRITALTGARTFAKKAQFMDKPGTPDTADPRVPRGAPVPRPPQHPRSPYPSTASG